MFNGKRTEKEAREVLGVSATAKANEIREAYKRLIKKLHPDAGGNPFLASQINAAKATLLGE